MPSRRTSRSTTTSIVCCSYRASSSSRPVGELDDLAVDPDAGEALLRAARRAARRTRPSGRARPGRARESGCRSARSHDPVDDLLRALAGDRPPAVRAVRHADAGVEQAEVVVDLGDGADGRAGVARGRLLVDRDRRRQALDEVDVGLVHLAEELAGVGRERLDVAALALGVDGVEGERGLARAGQPGEDDQPVAGQLERDVLQVVLAGAANVRVSSMVARLPAHQPTSRSSRRSERTSSRSRAAYSKRSSADGRAASPPRACR